MGSNFTLAIAGDFILNKKWSVITDERFLEFIRVIRGADVGYIHLESVIHDYDGPEVYPCAEGACVWQRSPRWVADELKWAGFDLVSLASNHSLDYSYGGLFSTIQALDEVNLVHAGTGKNLYEARQPGYLDTAKGRVALISMASTFAPWAKAGEARRDVKGRPGLNPLRFYYTVDKSTMETIRQLAINMNYSIENYDNMWLIYPWGLCFSYFKFVVKEESGISTVAEEDDVEGNLQVIKEARTQQAKFVIVQVHSHEYDPQKGSTVPPKFIPPFARACIDAGADVFVAEGTHSLGRGIEIYKGKPIFYEPGDLTLDNIWPRHPSDMYFRPGFDPKIRRWDATASEATQQAGEATIAAAHAVPDAQLTVLSDKMGLLRGCFVPVCTFNDSNELREVKLYPISNDKPQFGFGVGLPFLADFETSRKMIEFMQELSAPYGTKIDFRDGIGYIRL